jgi:outer membrane protein OmpA-like peptidoglycan-associated protein
MSEISTNEPLVRGRTLAEVRKHDWLKSAVLLGLLANALFFCGRGANQEVAQTVVPAVVATVPVVEAVKVDPAKVEPAKVEPAKVEPAKVAVQSAPPAAKLYFDTGKFDLRADADSVLKATIDYAKATPSAKLTVSGFHDQRGNAQSNAELAKNRAKVVAAKLNELGIMESRIFLEKPTEIVGGGNDQEARRVEVGVAN